MFFFYDKFYHVYSDLSNFHPIFLFFIDIIFILNYNIKSNRLVVF